MNIDQLQELMWSFAAHRVVTVAARTGMLDRLAGEPLSADALAKELELDPLAAGKVVRALTALGLTEPAGESYRLVPALAPHFQAGPGNLTPFLLHAHQLYDGWGANLEQWVTGQTPPVTRRRGAHPDPKGFGAAMQAMGTNVARQVAAALDLTGVKRMLDVGGSFGHYARAICEAAPELQATVLDLKEVVEIGKAQLAGTDVADRITFQAGSYLDTEVPAEYDLVFCANVLHQEAPEQAAAIVGRGAAALKPGGRFVVLDFAIDEKQRGHVLGALFAINMRSFGDTYPESTIRGWLEAAGLESVTRTDLGPHRWLITGHKAQ